MHGIVMNQFQAFAADLLGRGEWAALAAGVGAPAEGYRVTEVYPDRELTALVLRVSQAAGLTLAALLERFGAFIAPALLRVYEPLVRPEWRTLDVIEHTEETIHTVVRRRMEGATPPALSARRASPARVEVDYRSERRMCALAEGIARGLAAHFGEEVRVSQPECMNRGDARCLLVVEQLPAAPARP